MQQLEGRVCTLLAVQGPEGTGRLKVEKRFAQKEHISVRAVSKCPCVRGEGRIGNGGGEREGQSTLWEARGAQARELRGRGAARGYTSCTLGGGKASG